MTLAAVVDANGITAPSYPDILSALQSSYKAIYGSDVDLDADTQDGQWISVAALAIFDANSTAIAVYNQFSPATAQGVGLSTVVKINGIARLSPTSSTVDLTLIGQAGTTILSGRVGDNAGLGTQWVLPDAVLIPFSGTITVQATSAAVGDVTAAANTLTEILTPVPGWQTVNNGVAAVQGAPVEDDAALRLRQSKSTSLPAISTVDAIYADIANLAGVQRLTIHENDTGSTDSDGVPGHSISAVVEGGDPVAIATAIMLSKCPGTGTFGTITQTLFDPKGIPNTISFDALDVLTIKVIVFAAALPGYVSSTADRIKASAAYFLSNLEIGEDSYLSRLWGPLGLSGDAATLSSGVAQATLDVLARTYNVETVAQALPDMDVTGGPYGAGSTAMDVENIANFGVGDSIWLQLDNDAWFHPMITGVSGTTIDFTPAVPAGRSILTGEFVFLVGDLIIAFNSAAAALSSDIAVTVT